MTKKMDHVSLSVSDLDRSVAFYRDILGLKLLFQEETSGKEFETLFGAPPGFRARVAEFKEGVEISQFISPPGRDLNLETWDIGVGFLIFHVTELDKIYSDLVEKGVKFASPPVTMKSPLPGGGLLKAVHMYGPDGERISLDEVIKP
jgi:catechol 2,3-dioxygenase-like lactoylglutathione lyase family enzyme